MDLTLRVCDKKDCKANQGTRRFSIFVERKADQAGGMEDWEAVFDLCPFHAANVLQEFFSDLKAAVGMRITNVEGWLKNREINYHLG